MGEELLPKASAGEMLALRQLGSPEVATIKLAEKSDNISLARAYLSRASFLEELGAAEEAVADCRKAAELDDSGAAAHNLLAWINADKLGVSLEEATAEAERAVQLAESKPEQGNYLDTLGWVWYKRGNLKKARYFLRQAVELAEPDLTIRKHLEQVEKAISEAGDKEA